jgi:hypothetical protein
MGDDLFFYEVLLLALLWLYVAGYWRRPRGRPKIGRAMPTPATPPQEALPRPATVSWLHSQAALHGL